MQKRYFSYLGLIALFLINVNLIFSLSTQADSRACNAITKGCVSNISEISIIDEELLQACKDCCSISQVHVPNSVKGVFKGCTPRCQKACTKAYNKAVSKLNSN